jgi:hypothetical protein
MSSEMHEMLKTAFSGNAIGIKHTSERFLNSNMGKLQLKVLTLQVFHTKVTAGNFEEVCKIINKGQLSTISNTFLCEMKVRQVMSNIMSMLVSFLTLQAVYQESAPPGQTDNQHYCWEILKHVQEQVSQTHQE